MSWIMYITILSLTGLKASVNKKGPVELFPTEPTDDSFMAEDGT